MIYPEVLKVVETEGGICIYQVVKFGSLVGPCLCCGDTISPYSFGLVTIVDEGHAWCYGCAQLRLRKTMPYLYEYLINLIKEDDNEYGC